MPGQYQIDISMPGDTVTALQDNRFSLYGFQVVRASAGASPVVWFMTRDFALTTVVLWETNYQAYTSRSEIRPDVQIQAGASYPASLGQLLTVSNAMGIGEVGPGPRADGIGILNTTSTPFTGGLQCRQPDGGVGPICALNLLGNDMDVIVPTEQVFLMFSTLPITSGTVVEQAYGPGILIDLTASHTQSVSYDIEAGWSWAQGAGWAQTYPPDQSLAPLLIQPMTAPGS